MTASSPRPGAHAARRDGTRQGAVTFRAAPGRHQPNCSENDPARRTWMSVRLPPERSRKLGIVSLVDEPGRIDRKPIAVEWVEHLD